MSTRTKAGIAVLAVLVVAACGLWALKVGGSTPKTVPTGGPRGPASQAAAKLDALGLASAEETVYAGRQSYLAIPKTSGVIEMGQTVVHLSPQDSASVALNPSATGYCIVVARRRRRPRPPRPRSTSRRSAACSHWLRPVPRPTEGVAERDGADHQQLDDRRCELPGEPVLGVVLQDAQAALDG